MTCFRKISVCFLTIFLSIFSYDVYSQMSGAYTINQNALASSTNFIDVKSAMDTLNSQGVSGPTIFVLSSGSGPYQGSFTIDSIKGSSATNNVSFIGYGDTLLSDSVYGGNLMIIERADNFTIDGLVFDTRTNGGGSRRAIWMRDHVNNLTIRNSTFILSDTNNVGAAIVQSNSPSISNYQTVCHDLTFENNLILGGGQGFYLTGDSTEKSSNYIFRNNEFINTWDLGRVEYLDGFEFSSNDYSKPDANLSNYYSWGLVVYWTEGQIKVSNNRFHDLWGDISSTAGNSIIQFIECKNQTSSKSLVVNNMFYHLKPDGTYTSIAPILISECEGMGIYHNTFSFESIPLPYLDGFTVFSFGLSNKTSNNIDIRNNLISAPFNGNILNKILYDIGDTNSTVTTDYNVFYHADYRVSWGSYGPYGGNSLANWQNATGFDLNTDTFPPYFRDWKNDDLTPTSFRINNMCLPIPGITKDINGKTRNALNPDPGAIEFDPIGNDVVIMSLSYLNTDSCETGYKQFQLVSYNNGTNDLNSIPLEFVKILGSTMDTLTLQIDSIKSGEYDTLIIDSVQMLGSGLHNFLCFLTSSLDSNRTNNSMSTRLNFISAPPKPVFDDIYWCADSAISIVQYNGPNYIYNWYADSNAVVPFLTGYGKIFNWGFPSDTSFWLTQADLANSCESKGNFLNVLIDDYPDPPVSYDSIVCESDTFTLFIPYDSANFHVWYAFASSTVPIDTADTLTVNGLFFPATRRYAAAKVSLLAKCPSEKVEFEIKSDRFISGRKIYDLGKGLYNFLDESTGAKRKRYWSFGDGNGSANGNVTHQYQANGTYPVYLATSGLCGIDTIRDTITVKGVYIGIEEKRKNDDLVIYPNPTDGDLNIYLTRKREVLSIQLMDGIGKVLEELEYKNTSEIRLEIDQPKGVYFLHMFDGQRSSAYRIIKN